jgi:hypothetical protein
MTMEIWSIVSSVVSVILGAFAIWLSIYFFVRGKSTERDVSKSLSKIEAQADSLQRLNARWMDRLTRYVTEARRTPSDDAVRQLISILSQMPQTVVATLTQVRPGVTHEALVRELHSAYIALYFYTACTNYWSQFYLPDAGDFDQANQFHAACARVVDMSSADFAHMTGILRGCDQGALEANHLAPLLAEARGFWALQVHSTSQVFVLRERARPPAE